MLWLAGLMGLMAIGSVTLVDLNPEDDDDAQDTPEPLPPDRSANLILGTDTADAIDGSDGMDRISGAAGDDLIDAADGDDEARGDAGNDTINGGAANDHLIGQDDDDVLWGDTGDDTLNGSEGDDLLFGGAGDDALSGGLGNDLLRGDAGVDSLFGGAGNDTLIGLAAGMDGDGPSDTDTADFLNGGGVDDLIIAGQDDVVHGGSGADQLVLGEWITQAASIIDFEPEEDSLLFIWDDSNAQSEPPDVVVQADPENEGQLQVWMGDQIVAQVSGPSQLDMADISLISLSSAKALELVQPFASPGAQ
jgi:Ca2+-binding RTX toxin-like protein